MGATALAPLAATVIGELFKAFPIQAAGWLFLFLFLCYELLAPLWLGLDTAMAPIVRDVPEQVEALGAKHDDLRTDVENVRENVEDVQEYQKLQMQVQRAQARATENMDEQRVDEYLLRNGVVPEEFLRQHARQDTADDAEEE